MGGLQLRLASGLLLTLAILVAAGAVAVAKIPWLPWWSEAAVAALAFLAGLVLDPFNALVANWVEQPARHQASLRAQTRMHDRRGYIRRVRSCRQADALALGVKPALQDATSAGGLPAYVLRDVEAVRDSDETPALAAALAQGGFVIIEGASAAGKTRTAFEAMRRHMPDRWLIVPDNHMSLHKLKKWACGCATPWCGWTTSTATSRQEGWMRPFLTRSAPRKAPT